MSQYTLESARSLTTYGKALDNVRGTQSIQKWVVFNVKYEQIETVSGNGEVIYNYITNGSREHCIAFAFMSDRLRMIYNGVSTGIPNKSTGIVVKVDRELDLIKVRELLVEYVANVVE